MTTAAVSTPTTRSTPVMTHRQILFVIFGLMAGMFLSALDQTVVGTAIRTIGDDLPDRPHASYKRRIGDWLLWRAGPASGAPR